MPLYAVPYKLQTISQQTASRSAEGCILCALCSHDDAVIGSQIASAPRPQSWTRQESLARTF